MWDRLPKFWIYTFIERDREDLESETENTNISNKKNKGKFYGPPLYTFISIKYVI